MNKNKILTGLIVLTFLAVLTSCYTPSPLYGTWSDNAGDKIAFIDDGSFTSSIAQDDSTNKNYSGNWAVIDNVLTLNVTYEDLTYKRVSEWDIRGAMLYLDWTDENGTSSRLTLYHIAR